MPVFDYKCSCGKTQDNKIVKSYKDVIICECQKEMVKLISAPSLGGMNNLGQSKKED